MEIGADDIHVLQVTCAHPYIDCLRGEAAVGEGKHSSATGFENARNLAAHSQGLREVVNTDGIRHNIKRIVVERQHSFQVQVFDHKRIDVRVAVQLTCIHTECNAPPRKVRDVRREMRKVGCANVEYGWPMPLPEQIGIVLREAERRCLVNMVAESRIFVEARVGRLVQPAKVDFCERPG